MSVRFVADFMFHVMGDMLFLSLYFPYFLAKRGVLVWIHLGTVLLHIGFL